MHDTRLKRKSSISTDEESSFMPISDMFVGIIFIFLIIFASFWLQLNNAERSLEVQIKNNLQTRTAILRQLKDKIKLPEDVTIILNERVGGIAFIAKNGFFRSGFSNPSNNGEMLFRRLAEVMQPILACHSISHRTDKCSTDSKGLISAILIEGHADSTRMSSGAKYKSNLELSAARAAEAYKQILAAGNHFLQYKNENHEPLFGVSAYGNTRPIEETLRIPYKGEKQRTSQDRRIELRIIMAAPILRNNA